ncbi:MAG: NAD(+)/NADH kinase [Candidatus Undinarchaeales archaeon]|jgi:NAD+ kinase|nr:NAD(+)/NADH kinase [Candidatus Undinarchaeales archaeon]MDP7491535.1 NAD(+)/NADH kinase [Candidatus Undinarchaeales archaeon]
MRIGLFVKRSDQALSIARTIHDHLRKKGLEIILNEENAKVLGMEPYPGVPDMMIAVGGDGSLLHAETHHPGVPLVCIRVGSLNFLSDIEVEDMLPSLDTILDGDYDTEDRLKLSISGLDLPDALNEVAIMGTRPGFIIEYEVYTGDKLVEKVRADGLIVATPTGSTAYSLACGGPVVDWRVEAFVVVPVSPFKLSARPSVVSTRDRLRIVLGDQPATVVVDGQCEATLPAHGELVLAASEQRARLIRLVDINYFERARFEVG